MEDTTDQAPNNNNQIVLFKPFKQFKQFKPFKPFKPFKLFKPFEPLSFWNLVIGI